MVCGLGVPLVDLHVFIRKKKNKSGSISVQLIDKSSGKYVVKKSIGSGRTKEEITVLMNKAREEILQIKKQTEIEFEYDQDKEFLNNIENSFKGLSVAGPELILGKLFDEIGFNKIPKELFRHLVITRLVYAGSKLKTVDYLMNYKGIQINVDQVYRYLDEFNLNYKEQVTDIVFNHTKKILNDQISIAFYDITTLYFETSTEDDLRRLGFSKDGKAQNPQILIGLLVGIDGQPLAYEVFEGNRFEGHTLIPVVEEFKKKYNIPSLIIIADAGLLSKDNIEKLRVQKYPFILGGRLKNEPKGIKEKILSLDFKNGQSITIQKAADIKLVVNYTSKRAKKDAYTRKEGLQRLEKKLKAGKLTKQHINNRGYNKYLKIKNEISAEIDYEAFKEDNRWNGLKGYITNCELTEEEIISNYRELWNIEKAFRISKTDLKVRPIYHRLERRIKTHICLAFCSYKLYKELERQLKLKESKLSVDQALSILKTIYKAKITLPKSKKTVEIYLPLNKDQKSILYEFEIQI